MAKNKKKKSKIASLDLKNYKAKYADAYGLGAEKPFDDEKILEEEPESEPEPPPPPPKPEPKIETPLPKPEPKSEQPKLDQSPKPAPKPEPKPPEKFEDIVRRVEHNKRKMHLREPVTVNVRREIKDRPIGGVNRAVEDTSERENRPPRRVETYGIAISAVALVYSFYIADKALFFLSMSLFTYLLRPIVGPMFGKRDQAVQNALKGFSIAVFFGAILFIFC